MTFRSSADVLDCNATDGASTVTFHLQFRIDKDPPLVTGEAPDRSPNANGWYNAPVTVTFAGSDATSGIASCTKSAYSGPDRGGASVAGTCRDQAGNVSAPSSFGLSYDATPPAVTVAAARVPDSRGWYNHAVAVAFSGVDATSGGVSCDAAKTYGGPDSATANVSGSCTDAAGNRGTGAATLGYDASPPGTTASPARAADSNGWYNHSVTVAFTGADAGSGGVVCDAAKTYSGPDSAGASVRGACTDAAGNAGDASFALKYDSTPPRLRDVAARPADRLVRLSWAASPDATSVAVSRAPARGGAAISRYAGAAKAFTDTGLANGVRYRYTVVARDGAGNQASSSVLATPLALFRPAAGAKVSAPVVLQWGARPRARYYNLQLFRRGKVMSIWPRTNHVRLPEKWTYAGKRYRLEPGRYRWYVWPGRGARRDATYGPLIGSSEFRVAA